MSEEENLGQNSTSQSEPKKTRANILWPELNTPEWISSIAAGVAAVAAIAAVVVAVQTRVILQGQLDQMASGSAATDRIIELQAQLNAAVGFEGAATDRLAGNTKTLANTAQGQLTEMRDEQRPVIDVATIESVAPLQIDPVIGIFVRFDLINVGKSTSVLTYPHAKLILGLNTDVMKRQQQACSAPVKTEAGNAKVGFNIRTGVTMPVEIGYVLTEDETKAWKNRPEARMLLVGCVDYLFDGRHHHTPFVREVDKADAAAPEGWVPINPNTDKIDKGGLVFLVPPWDTAQPD